MGDGMKLAAKSGDHWKTTYISQDRSRSVLDNRGVWHLRINIKEKKGERK